MFLLEITEEEQLNPKINNAFTVEVINTHKNSLDKKTEGLIIMSG